MCELTIRRQMATRDRRRRYKVVVDGNEVGSVKAGSTWAGRLAPGRHLVEMRIDWKCSPALEVDALPGRPVDLRCGPTGGAFDGLAQIFKPSDRYLYLMGDSPSDGDLAATDEPDQVGDFTVLVDTQWGPPSGSAGMFGLIGNVIDASTGGGQLPTGQIGEPRWRVVLQDGKTPIATSAWSGEWVAVERVKGDWISRLQSMEPSEVRATAGFWQ
jgi:hypothetical protein